MKITDLYTRNGLIAAIKAHHKNLHKNHSFPPLNGVKPVHCFAELFENPANNKPFESAEPFEAALDKLEGNNTQLGAKSSHIPEHDRHFITTHPKNNQDVVIEYNENDTFIRAFYEADVEDVEMTDSLRQDFTLALAKHVALTSLAAQKSEANTQTDPVACPVYLNLSKEGFSQIVKVHLFDDSEAMGMDHATVRVQCLNEKDFSITTVSKELLKQPLQSYYLDSNHALVTIGYVQVVVKLNERYVSVNVIEQNEKLPLNPTESAFHDPRCEHIDNEHVLKSLNKDDYAKTVHQYLGMIDQKINMSQGEINQAISDELSVIQATNRKLDGQWRINTQANDKICIALGDQNPLKFLKHGSSSYIEDVELTLPIKRDDDVLIFLNRGAGKRFVRWQDDLVNSIVDLTDR